MACKLSINAGNIFIFLISISLVSTTINIMSNNIKLSTIITDFACRINQLVEPDKNENIFTSSLSVFNVLMLILAGAKGNTETQMATAMAIPSQDKKVIYGQLRDLITEINKGNAAYTLSTANQVYIDTLELLPEYSEIINTYFSSSLQKVDFSKTVQALKTINDWVNQQTHGKISSILSDLPENTKLVLVNAIYFKANWKYTFNKADTKKNSFTTADGKIVQTDMMSMKNPNPSFNYTNSKNLRCEILELPYAGQVISMYIFLPPISTPIATFVNTLNAQNINEAIKSKTLHKMEEISIPKMHLEKSYKLSTCLNDLGIKDLFLNSANLKGITQNVSLKVDKIVQKTYLDVDEEGTTAAAVTGAVIVALSAQIEVEPKIKFIANRPFVFIIHDNTNNIDYFMGSYAHP